MGNGPPPQKKPRKVDRQKPAALQFSRQAIGQKRKCDGQHRIDARQFEFQRIKGPSNQFAHGHPEHGADRHLHHERSEQLDKRSRRIGQ